MYKICAQLQCQALYGRLNPGNLCPKCRRIEDAFDIIRDFLIQHPEASVIEVYQQTNIPVDIIENLLASGRLNRQVVKRCNRCRSPLPEAEHRLPLCLACKHSMGKALGLSLAKPRTDASPATVISLRNSYGIAKNAR